MHSFLSCSKKEDERVHTHMEQAKSYIRVYISPMHELSCSLPDHNLKRPSYWSFTSKISWWSSKIKDGQHTRGLRKIHALQILGEKPYKIQGPGTSIKFFRDPLARGMQNIPSKAKGKLLHLVPLPQKRSTIPSDHCVFLGKHISYLWILFWPVYQVAWKAASSKWGLQQKRLHKYGCGASSPATWATESTGPVVPETLQ